MHLITRVLRVLTAFLSRPDDNESGWLDQALDLAYAAGDTSLAAHADFVVVREVRARSPRFNGGNDEHPHHE